MAVGLAMGSGNFDRLTGKNCENVCGGLPEGDVAGVENEDWFVDWSESLSGNECMGDQIVGAVNGVHVMLEL